MKKPKSNRISRIENDIKQILSEVLSGSVRDPGIPPLTSITRVELTRDMGIATVYVTSSTDDHKELLETLKRAKGFMRSQLGEELTIFRTPDLVFKYDEGLAYENRIEELLFQIRSEEKKEDQ